MPPLVEHSVSLVKSNVVEIFTVLTILSSLTSTYLGRTLLPTSSSRKAVIGVCVVITIYPTIVTVHILCDFPNVLNVAIRLLLKRAGLARASKRIAVCV
jgi:hypothetical protein